MAIYVVFYVNQKNISRNLSILMALLDQRDHRDISMNIHEYQAKALLRSYGAPVSDGRIVLKSEDAKTAAGELDGPIWVVKAWVLSPLNPLLLLPAARCLRMHLIF